MRAARSLGLLIASVLALEAFPGCDSDLFKTGEHPEPDAESSPAGASGQAGEAGSSSGGKANGGSGAGNAKGGSSGSGAGTGGQNGSGAPGSFDGGASTGGAPAVGGSNGLGGAVTASGGAITSGGSSNAGGSTGSGGKASGGAAGAGGVTASGGHPASGGANTSGGGPSTGGAPNRFPTTAILDNFNRQDLGSNWTGDNTSFGIVSSHLECSYCLVPEFWSAQFAEPQEAYLTIASFDPTTKEVNVVMMAQDGACDQIEILYAPDMKEIRIDYCYDGQWRSTASFARTLGPGDRFGGRMNANGTVDIFVNGTAVKQYDLSDFPYKGGYIGVSGDTPNGTSIAVDDFGGGSL